MRKYNKSGAYPFYNNNRIFYQICIVLLTTTTALAAANTCKPGCSNDPDHKAILKYLPGHVYEYSVDSELSVGLANSNNNNINKNNENDDNVNLKISANAKLYAEGNCAYTLELNAAKVTSSEDKVSAKQLQHLQNPVHFTLQNNGRVEPTLCIESDDNTYALNIKRAIISLLQNQIPNHDSDFNTEFDIFGECATRSTQRANDNGGIILTKVRNLATCSQREHLQSGLMAGGVVHGHSGGILNLQSDYYKESKISAAGIIEHVQITEIYTDAVASAGGATSPKAKVHTTLKLKAPGAAGTPPKVSGKHTTSILFDAVPSGGEVKNIAALKQALNEITEKLNNGQVQQNAANNFVELIRMMRVADSDTLLELAQQQKGIAYKAYLDALFRAGTSASAHAILKQLPKMSKHEQFVAVYALHLVKNVDKATLKAAKALINANTSQGAYLAIGHLVKKYCEQAPSACVADIEEIAQQFAANLKQCKASTLQDEERILGILKGIGNMGEYVSTSASIIQGLSQCLANEHVSQRLRVAALQSVAKAASCNDALQKRALELFKDRQEDSEVRIEAYLVAIECANNNDAVAHTINEVLQDEPSYQVGGFVVSSLRVLRDSADDSRAKQRANLLQHINIDDTNKYPINWHRYSFNHEISYKYPAMGMSASADLKTIYSQQAGFLPRAARLNLTSELYGNNFNILDLSVRQENIERILEYYFGPKGLLNKDFDDIVKTMSSNVHGSRSRRSLVTDAQKHAKKYKTYGQKQQNDAIGQHINFDMSLKLFGSEMGFLALGDNLPQSIDDLMNLLSTSFETIKKDLKGFEKQFTFHTLFLDSQLTYATSVGVPLEFSAQGFAASQFDVAAKIDIDAILAENLHAAPYRIKLVPSIDANVQLIWGFKTPTLNTGIRIYTKMHTATGSDINLTFGNDGKSFKADIELPQERLQLINLHVGSDYYVSEADKSNTKSISLEKSSGNNNVATPDSICFNQLEEYTGFDFCIVTNVMQIDWANGGDAVNGKKLGQEWPLMQPLTLELYVSAPKHLQISGKKSDDDVGIKSISFNYATPGSSESHDSALVLTLNSVQKNARISFDNPKLRLAAEVGMKNDAKELVFYAQYENDNKVHRSKIGFDKLTANEYKPVIEWENMNGEVQHNLGGYEATGKVRIENPGRYNFDKFTIKHTSGEQLIQLNGWVQLQDNAAKTDLHVTLINKETYVIVSHANMPKAGYYDVGLFVNNEKQPEYVYGGSVNAKLLPNDVGVSLVAKARDYEANLNSNTKYQLNDNAQDDVHNNLKSLTTSNDLNVKHKQDLMGSVKLEVDIPNNNELKIILDLLRHKHNANVNVQLKHNVPHVGDFLADIKANYNKHTINLVSKGEKQSETGRLQLDTKLSTSWGPSGTLHGLIGEYFTPQQIYVDLKGDFQISVKQKQQQWLVKVIGAQDKTTADLQLKNDGVELIKLNGDWQHAQEKVHAANFNIMLKQLLNGKIDFKINKNGKGELNGHAELTDTTENPKKLDINSKFHLLPPNKYDVDAIVLLNQEQVFHIKSDNVVEKNKLTSSNVVDIGKQRYLFNANGNSKGELRTNGELQGKFDLTLANGRRYDFETKRKITTNPKTGLINGMMEWQLSATETDGKKSELQVKGKIDKLLPAQKLLIHELDVHYKNSDSKEFGAKWNLKHLPKNNGKSHSLDLQVITSGNMLTNQLEIKIKSDEYSYQLAGIEVESKFGDMELTKIAAHYDLTGYKNNKKPINYDMEIKLNLPSTQFKKYELKSNAKYQRPHNEQAGLLEGNFEQKVDEKPSHVNFKASVNRDKSNFDVNVKCNKMSSPLVINGNYDVERDHEKHAYSAKYNLNSEMGDKYLKTSLESKYNKAEGYKMHYNLAQSEAEALKQLDVKIDAHNLNEHDYEVKLAVKHNNDNKYTLDSVVYGGGGLKQGFELFITAPQLKDKLIVLCLSEMPNPNEGKLRMELSQVFGLDLKASAEGKYYKIDDFKFIINWTSEKLNLKEYELLVETQKGKKLHINLKNAQETILDGVATHSFKQEANKYIVEGQGQLQYRGQQNKQGNFRLIKQNYEVGADKEIGVSYSLNGQVGTKKGVANLKLTNREFNVKLSVCEEKKQCTNLQIQSLVNMDDDDNSKHSLLVLVDLRELGYPYEFELQSKTQRQGYKAQYSLDSSLVSHNNHRYQLVASLSSGGAGRLLIKLPKRDVLLELQQKVPANNGLFGHYEQTVTLWLDHARQPDQMTKISVSGSLEGDVGQHASLDAKGIWKLEHPGMRTLSADGHIQASREKQLLSADIKLDVFKAPEQKLTISHKVQNILAHDTTSNGFNITVNSEIKAPAFDLVYHVVGHTAYNNHKYSSFVNLALNDMTASSFIVAEPVHVHFEVNALEEAIILVHGKWSRTKDSVKSHTKLQFLGQKPVDIESEVQTTQAKFSIKQENSLDAETSYKLGKELSVKVNGEKGENYLNGHVALDSGKFLETTYTSDLDKLKKHLKQVEVDVQENTGKAVEKIRKKFDKLKDAAEKQKENIKSALPNVEPLYNNLKNNMNAIVQELEADPMIQKIAQISRKIYEAVEQFLIKVHHSLMEFYKNVAENVNGMYHRLHETIQRSILPMWQELVLNLTKLLSKIRNELFEISVNIWDNLMKLLEKYAPILKSYAVVLHDTLKYVHEMTQEFHKMLAHELENINNEIKDLLEHLKTEKLTPLLERLKVQWKHWKITEQLVEFVNLLFDQLNVLPQTPENLEFLQHLHKYIVEKLQNDGDATITTNDSKTIETLVQLAIKAIRSIISELGAHAQNPHITNMLGWSPNSGSLTQLWSQTVNALNKLPTLFSLRVSLINFILNEPWAKDISHNHGLQRTWYSILQPFDLSAHLVNGAQYISYDGVYGDFKADGSACKYILAQDSIDQNFTIVAQTHNKKLRSITLITRDDETLEIFENGQLKANGQAVEYPQHGADLHAWHNYYTVWIRSQYGVEIVCLTDLTVCHLTVNGFYAGRLRGILGNANAEPFDDRLLPEGTLAHNNKDLAQAYALGGKCNAIEGVPQTEAVEICDELFAWDSTLSGGILFEDVKTYREGCYAAVQGLENDKAEELACQWAFSYVSGLRLQHVLLRVPDRCLKCPGTELGHEQQIKLPNNKADIVFIVDVNVKRDILENLIAPALGELREALKARSFTDIQIGVVVYNETQRYPALLTSNGGKLNYEGNLAEVSSLGGPTATLCDGCLTQSISNPRLLDIFKQLQDILHRVLPNAEKEAFELGFRYPFRAHATSTIVSVRSTPFSIRNMLRFVQASFSNGLINAEKTILHLIAPIEKMSVEGINDEKLLGFNSRLIATLDGKDPKKRSKLLYGNENSEKGINMVLKSGGWVFNTEHFESLKPQERKKALNQITSTIADTTFKTELITECTCNFGLHAEYDCSVKSSNFLPNKKVKAKK